MSALEDARAMLHSYTFNALDGSGAENECIGRPLDAAAHALLAIAEEQRTANLIAHLKGLVADGGFRGVDVVEGKAIGQEIRKRLGLGDQS